MKTWRIRMLLAVPTIALLAAACSSGGTPGKQSSGAPAGTATSQPTTQASCQTEAGLFGAVADHGTATVSGTAVKIEAGDQFFAPTCLSVGRGTVRVAVTNTGRARHNFSITSLGIDKDVAAGKTISVRVKLLTSGPLPFFCKYHTTKGMQGAFLIGSR